VSPHAEQRRAHRDAALALRRRVVGWVGIGAVALTGVLLLTAENTSAGSADSQTPATDSQLPTDQAPVQDPYAQNQAGQNAFGQPAPAPAFAPGRAHAVTGGS
jgi:hypothetical protein